MSRTIATASRANRSTAGQPCDACMKPFSLRQRTVTLSDTTRFCLGCFAVESAQWQVTT